MSGQHPLIREMRDEIDTLDNQIFDLIQRRLGLCQRIGEMKATSGLPLSDPDRESKMMARLLDRQQNELLDEATLRGIYQAILNRSKDIQKNKETVNDRRHDLGP